MSTSTTLILYCTGDSIQAIRQRKDIKVIQIIKEGLNMFLFTAAMIMQKIQRDKHAYTDVHHTHTHTHTHT